MAPVGRNSAHTQAALQEDRLTPSLSRIGSVNAREICDEDPDLDEVVESIR